MTSEKDKVWDRLKNGVNETKAEKLRRCTTAHFDTPEFEQWRNDLRAEYEKVIAEYAQKNV